MIKRFIKCNYNKLSLVEKILIIVIIFYIIIQSVVFFLPILTSDEEWFYGDAQIPINNVNIDILDITAILLQDNHLGYGAAFWIAISLIKIFLSTHSQLTIISFLRFLFFGLYISIPIIISFFCRKTTQKYYLPVFIWLILPGTWFTGKLISVEIPSMFFAICGSLLILFTLKKPYSYIGYAFFGFSLGLKATSIPLFVFVLIIDIFSKPKRKIYSLLWTVPGFIIANPFLLFDGGLLRFIQNLNPSPSPITMNNIQSLFFNSTSNNYGAYCEPYTWDVIFSGSYYTLGLTPITILSLFIILINEKQRTELLAFFVALLCSVYLFSTRHFFGWYLFPTLFIIPLLLFKKPYYNWTDLLKGYPNKMQKYIYLISILLLFGNIFFVCVPQNIINVGDKIDHYYSLNQYQNVTESIANYAYTQNNKDLLIINRYEIFNYPYHQSIQFGFPMLENYPAFECIYAPQNEWYTINVLKLLPQKVWNDAIIVLGKRTEKLIKYSHINGNLYIGVWNITNIIQCNDAKILVCKKP